MYCSPAQNNALIQTLFHLHHIFLCSIDYYLCVHVDIYALHGTKLLLLFLSSQLDS